MNDQKTFSISEAVSFGWAKAKKYWLFFLGIGLLTGFISSISSWASANQRETHDSMLGLVQLAASLFSMVLSLGEIKILLSIVDGKEPVFADLFSQFSKFWKMLGASIVYMFIVLGGLLLLIVPGIIWGVRYSLYSYFIVEKNYGPIQALKASSAATQGNKGQLFLLSLTSLGIIILGVLALVVGLILAYPTTMLALAYVYRKLESQMGKESAPVNQKPALAPKV